MIGRVLGFLRYLVPPAEKASYNHVLAWRWTVAVAATVALVMSVAGTGVIPRVSGYVYAADVDDKIQQALAPVNKKLESIDRKQTENTSYIKRLVKSDIAFEIHAEKLVWCRATESSEKQRVRRGIDDLQEEYEKVAGVGRKASEPDCA